MSVTFKEELKDIMVKQINGLTDVIVEVNLGDKLLIVMVG